MLAVIDLTQARRTDRDADPGTRAAWDFAHSTAPPRSGEVLTMCRFVIDRDNYQGPSPTLNAVPAAPSRKRSQASPVSVAACGSRSRAARRSNSDTAATRATGSCTVATTSNAASSAARRLRSRSADSRRHAANTISASTIAPSSHQPGAGGQRLYGESQIAAGAVRLGVTSREGKLQSSLAAKRLQKRRPAILGQYGIQRLLIKRGVSQRRFHHQFP